MTASRLPTAVTAMRVVCAAGFAVAVLAGWSVALLPLALLVELSDAGDGFLARRTRSASVVGNVYDGMADHVARTTEFICLASIGTIGLFPVLVVLWRDGAVVTMRLVATVSAAGFPTTRASGKAKGIAQGVCIVWLSATQTIPALDAGAGRWLSPALIWVAVGVTAVSGLDYVIACRGSRTALTRHELADWPVPSPDRPRVNTGESDGSDRP